MSFFRQTGTLVSKNLRIVVLRHGLPTIIRAFLLPIALTVFLSFARNLFVPPAVFGIGDSHAVRSLPDGLRASGHVGRDTVALVHSGLTGGAVERVVGSLASTVEGAGKRAAILDSEDQLATACPASLRGVTPCYGAVIFYSSPDEGDGGRWNYSIRSDSSLGIGKLDVRRNSNDGEVYMLPLQHAVDAAIAGAPSTRVYPFTSRTQAQRAERIRVMYQTSLMSFLGVGFFAGVVGICYHLAGFMASERESGMSTLLEAMMPTRYAWQPQAARLLSYHVAFSLVYLPGWVVGSVVLRQGVFAKTSLGVVLVYHVLAGLALASMSVFGAALFKKSQLSGVSVTIAYILLAILAQTLTNPRTVAVTVLSLLFAPSNYTFFITLLARWEREELPTDLTRTAPNSPWNLPGIALWIFLVVQIVVYPVLGALVERYLHGTSSSARDIVTNSENMAVRLDNFSKVYRPGFLRRLFSWAAAPPAPVVAVDGLSLSAGKGQIVALLGANGSGKSTTLDSIAGIAKPTSGKIVVDGTGGLGIAPQKNVLWDELTVEEHLAVFDRLKSQTPAAKLEIRRLVSAVDLDAKRQARSKTLSGGQKRKLQLGMMLTGGSAVCCVDEVSSGLDPLSRRKIWDILLAERGRRTVILTTHFLDEADLLADHIAILSRGSLRAQGASVELKDRLGGGYRIHVARSPGLPPTPDVAGVAKKAGFDTITYVSPSSALAAEVIRALEADGMVDYSFSGPTIEDVFLQLAEEAEGARNQESDSDGQEKPADTPPLQLLSGQRIGYFRQTWILFLKRCTVFKHNWFPYAAAFFLPVVAAGLVTLFVRDLDPVGCTPLGTSSSSSSSSSATDFLGGDLRLNMVGGPSSKFSAGELFRLFGPVLPDWGGGRGSGSGSGSASGLDPAALVRNITVVDTLDEFHAAVRAKRMDIQPAGLWLGDSSSQPTLAYRGDGVELFNAWFGQWALDMLVSNTSFASSFSTFQVPWAPKTTDSLQLLVYMGLALSAYPAFFALYPNVERRRHVRGLEYSNGVRALPLWLAYTLFDFGVVIVATAVAVVLLAALSHVWYHVGYLFVVFSLYGLTALLLSYAVSLFAANQLSAYAFTAASQAALLLAYLVAYLCTLTYAPVNRIDQYLVIVHFVFAAVAPIGSVIRSLFLALNLFSTACDGKRLAPNPGDLLRYGGPILYLIVQSMLLFCLVVCLDSGHFKSSVKAGVRASVRAVRNSNDKDEEATDPDNLDDGLAPAPGLRVVHVTKSFGQNTAVDDVSFSVPRGDVFALLGPNGAGKSTTISLIRGDVRPSVRGGDVLVDGVSVASRLAAARARLGVCPQFDAIDQMTVAEHLRFYARVRGVPDVDHNVAAVLRAVGLAALGHRQAHALSGGNKRKLSLAIALMGNPSVLLLDEPSSGLDAAAKRVMWRTLAATAPGRSILLTTHSMEEADALARRAGILARRMLALGTADELRRRFGDALHVHLVCRHAPHTPDHHIARLRRWVEDTFAEATVDASSYHGQMRFSVPVDSALPTPAHTPKTATPPSPIGRLVVVLEENRDELGIEHYSVSPTTLDQVFLAVVGTHGVQEEGYEERGKKKWWKR